MCDRDIFWYRLWRDTRLFGFLFLFVCQATWSRICFNVSWNCFGNGRDLNKSLMFGWKTFFWGEDGGSFKWSPLNLRFCFPAILHPESLTFKKTKWFCWKVTFDVLSKFPSLDQRLLIISELRLSSLGFIKPCMRGLIPKLNSG